ncbi:DciA family protein [Acetobacter sp. LMG 32666]|uniref:DciA family protein n=1 Tax=Acetobacter sp. LMG 32666 TaxID=2959295 RepID=UPI0038D12E01
MAKEVHSGKAGAPARQASPPRKPAPRARAKEEAPPPRRVMKALTLAALLPNVTAPAFRRRSPTGAMLFARWADIVGPAHAAVTTPHRLSAATLTVACAGPVAMELQHQADMLMARINTWCGEPLVARLRFVQDPTAGTRRRQPARKNHAPACTLPDMPDDSLRTALELLGTEILQATTKKT